MTEFKYAPMFQLGKDETEYRLVSKEGITVANFEGKEIVKVAPEALTLLAQEAFHDCEFYLRCTPVPSQCRNSCKRSFTFLPRYWNCYYSWRKRSADMDRIRRRRGSFAWCIQYVYTRKFALFSKCPTYYVRRSEHQMQPSCTD